MIKLGEMQSLVIAKVTETGAYLRERADDRKENDVFLPAKQIPEGAKQGDKVNVFIYKDSKDKMVATTKRPKLTVGEIGYLRVVEISKIGAFLNWGLDKDLFLPFKEQISEIRENGEYMVSIYVDKSNRLCATMNLYNVLRTDSPYKVNDKVNGTIFNLRRGLGAMVAVDDKYLGMINEKEIFKPLHIGDKVEVRVNQILEDGKLCLSLKDAPRLQIDKDGEYVYNKLLKNKGFLPYNDNSRPEEITSFFNMSKSSYKKAVGNLMKRHLIVMTRDGIEVADSTNSKNSIKRSSNKKPGAYRAKINNDRGYGKGDSDRRTSNNDRRSSSKDNSYGRSENKSYSDGNSKSYGKSNYKSNSRPVKK